MYVVKIFDENATGDIDSLIMGLQWVLDRDIRGANMSIAFRDDNPLVHLVVQMASEQGLIIVAAVGNHSNWINDGGAGEGGADDDATGDLDAYPVMYPAAYPEVIAVGAHDSLGYFADFSNDRPELDVTAPGVNVFSTTLDGGYGAWNGTSMAPPMSLPELQ